MKLRIKGWNLVLAGLFAIGVSGRLPAQVLARPGWAGSGVAPESWWRNAVFYRVDPSRFQASGESRTGDLAGLTQRLDYLQSLGVDALVLDGSYEPEGLDDLIREASRQHLRLLLTVTLAMQRGDRQALIQTVHGWLSAGAAGIFLPGAGPGGTSPNGGYASVVSTLNSVLRSFPGERVLLADPASLNYALKGDAVVTAAPRANLCANHRRGLGAFNETHEGQLTTAAELAVQPPSAAALRQSLAATAEGDPGGGSSGGSGLLRFAGDPATGAPDAAGAAAVLLAARGTAIFDFGDEIGLDAFPKPEAARAESLPVMQWTPANVQQAAAAPIERRSQPVTKAGETPFGAYHPYIHPPPRSLTGTAPAVPLVTVDGNLPAALPDPDTLPGFTAGELPNQPIEGERINVVTEDRDPNSLLNAYRQLIALHHGNATLRNGSQVVLNRDAQNAVVWVRRAPAGSRTAANVLVVANFGTEPITLMLDGDLAALGMRTGALRPLFTWSGQPLTGETTTALHLPPHAVFLGEVYHPGAAGQVGRPRRERR